MSAANTTRFTFKLSGNAEPFKVLAFTGTERLSTPFEFKVTVACEHADLEFCQILTQAGVLSFESATQHRKTHGIITRIAQKDSGHTYTTYELTLAPHIHRLSLRLNHQVFQDETVASIIQQIFNTAGIPSDSYQITGGNTTRAYCTQYGETDLAFISRLMAEEGLHYHFSHEADRHVMVISDQNNAFQSLPDDARLPLIADQSRAFNKDSIQQFSYKESLRSNQVKQSDYNAQRPRQSLQTSATENNNGTSANKRAVYHYPGLYQDTAVGNRYTQLRLAQHQLFTHTAEGNSNACVMAGQRFTLTKHSNNARNQEYLLYQVTHEAEQPQSLEEGAAKGGCYYRNEFTCIPSSTPFKPAVPEQIIAPGVLSATVTGPTNDEIYTDKLGRIKVQFHWDQHGQRDQNSSCWLHVNQSWAGSGRGSIALPRVGQEVLVNFQDSNPDRPLVIGSLYNGSNKPPYPLPQNKTVTGIKTRSTPRGTGYNELRIDDKKGQEQIFVQAEKDLDIRVRNDHKSTIENDLTYTIKGSSFQQIQKDHHHDVAGDHSQTISGKLSNNISKDSQVSVSGTHNIDASSALHLKAGMKAVIQAGSQISLKAGSGKITISSGGVFVSGPIVRVNEGGGGGSAQAPSPKAPSTPAEADQNQPGQRFTPTNQEEQTVEPWGTLSGNAQAVTLQLAAQTRAPMVNMVPSRASSDSATAPTADTSVNT